MKAGWMTMPLAFVATLAFLFAVGTSGAGIDADPDGDGHQSNIDNCSSVSNASQTDTDSDGYGNACDGDFNNSGSVDIVDFGLLKIAFGTSTGNPSFNPAVDCNEDGTIGVPDFGCFKIQFGAGVPGPSGRACAGTIPCPAPGLIPMPRAAQLP
jgi:hypothetical protein